MLNDKVVLLFFKDYERDSFFPNDRYIKRLLKPIYNRFRKTQKVSGFWVWCQLLMRALEEQGYDVRLNNYALAYHNPHYPIGLVGYPTLLDGWSLPNPAVLGPSLFDHPAQAPELMQDPRYKKYIVTCNWMYDQFAPVYGHNQVGMWNAGMDLDLWPDTRYASKSIDVLIYDKIRWKRDHYVPTLLTPIEEALAARGLRVETVRYGSYDHAIYKEQLEKSRTMLFLCEHETQGMAYQEALASNVPILAWDQGWWLDPVRPKYSEQPIRAASVPYFNEQCGERFKNADEFAEKFDLFWSQLDTYEPREYVKEELSFTASAERFLELYRAAALEGATFKQG